MYLVLYLSMRLFSCFLMSLALYLLVMMRLLLYLSRCSAMSLSKHLFMSLLNNIFSWYNSLEQNELPESVECCGVRK